MEASRWQGKGKEKRAHLQDGVQGIAQSAGAKHQQPCGRVRAAQPSLLEHLPRHKPYVNTTNRFRMLPLLTRLLKQKNQRIKKRP
jgi:hypothetical protein